MIHIVNKSAFDETTGLLTYVVPEDTAMLVIRPTGGYVQLVAGTGDSQVHFTILENEAFEIRSRDVVNRSLVFKQEADKTVTIEILRYSGVLS